MSPCRVPSTLPSSLTSTALITAATRTWLWTKFSKTWKCFSISSFIYPAHTGLSLHKDGRQIYSGAYTFFLSPFWDIHWGGLLIVLDPATKLADEQIKVHGQATASFANVWLDRDRENPHVYTPGLGHVVLPKRNRMVFINPDCLHMVTHVNEHAGDHVRMALSGFFHAKPPKW